MNKLAVIFPGQGSQYIGMGYDFYQKFSQAKKIFNEANQLLGDVGLSKIIFEGPDDELRLTTNTQPAILTTSIAIWNVIKDEINIIPSYFAGHSLGEYSALVAAESINFSDAVLLVRSRGKFMEEAVPNNKGAMSAIIGMERIVLEEICKDISKNGNVVQLANINAPNQIVISGSKEGVEKANKVAKENGARRAINLPVSGPFHSILMEPAKQSLKPLIEKTLIQDAKTPVVMNTNAKPEVNYENIKHNLVEQVVSPVLWTDTINLMVENGVNTIIEIGPEKVLAGLVKKINSNIKIINIDSIDALDFLRNNQYAVKGGE